MTEEWIKTLKVGDKVAFPGGIWHTDKIVSVTKITPSGRLNLSNGTTVNPDGYIRGQSYRKIKPVTQELMEEIARQKMLRLLKETDFNKFSNLQLNEILILINQLNK